MCVGYICSRSRPSNVEVRGQIWVLFFMMVNQFVLESESLTETQNSQDRVGWLASEPKASSCLCLSIFWDYKSI